MLPITCKECGALEEARYTPDVKLRLIKRSLCFRCDFWTNIYDHKDEYVIIDGQSFFIGEETDEPKYWKGHGGRKFLIEKDGEQITTTNLWHQGSIPEHFRSRLPDTAKFVQKD